MPVGHSIHLPLRPTARIFPNQGASKDRAGTYRRGCDITERMNHERPAFTTAVAPHLFLSEVHLTSDPTVLQVHSHLFAICRRGHQEAWTFQRTLPGHKTYIALPSLGRFRIRPRPVKPSAHDTSCRHTYASAAANSRNGYRKLLSRYLCSNNGRVVLGGHTSVAYPDDICSSQNRFSPPA